jgi:dienelactone hydrolase
LIEKMNNKKGKSFSRRQFVNIASGTFGGLLLSGNAYPLFSRAKKLSSIVKDNLQAEGESIIGPIGDWFVILNRKKLPQYSFRRKEWADLQKWHEAAQKQIQDRMAIPDLGNMPEVIVNKKYIYDGLQVEELSWQLPYGRTTEAILLKPANVSKPLPGILAFHDHGGIKYFGKRKITRTSDQIHPLIKAHQDSDYDGTAWANEIAKRGYVVLVSDTFPFASRRIMLKDVPEDLRDGLNDNNPEDPENIIKYNKWAGGYEDIMAKSLFCAGTTWPGVFFAEDRVALEILCAREDVDKERIGCGGLSGGGMRTVFMGGLDPRIKCAVCAGFMTTWNDFLLNKSFTHTWMTFIPVLPTELEFPEILGLRVPLPTMVLNNIDDDLYTYSEMEQADKILKEVYQKAGADDHYKCSFYPGPHKFDRMMQTEAFNWFDQWLKQ